MLTALAPHGCRSRPADAATRVLRRAQWGWTRGVLRRPNRKRFERVGLTVAVVGADGPGITTVAQNVADWLGTTFVVKRRHLGTPRPSVLTLGFKNAGARESFAGGGSDEILRQALIDMVGADWKVEAIIDPSAEPGATPPTRVTKPAVEPRMAAAPDPTPAVPDTPPDWAASGESSPQRPPSPEMVAEERAKGAPRRAVAQAREGITATRRGALQESSAPPDDPDAEADRDDADADESGLQGAELLQRELGATVIEEIPHE